MALCEQRMDERIQKKKEEVAIECISEIEFSS